MASFLLMLPSGNDVSFPVESQIDHHDDAHDTDQHNMFVAKFGNSDGSVTDCFLMCCTHGTNCSANETPRFLRLQIMPIEKENTKQQYHCTQVAIKHKDTPYEIMKIDQKGGVTLSLKAPLKACYVRRLIDERDLVCYQTNPCLYEKMRALKFQAMHKEERAF